MTTFSLTKDGSEFSLAADRGQANATGIWIPSLEVNDTGIYVFSTTNEAGVTNVTLSVTVYCKLTNNQCGYSTLI